MPADGSYMDISSYEKSGGYAGLRAALGMEPGAVMQAVVESTLRGRGGAGFPTGQKWSFVPAAPGPKYLAANADEMEPGTFKDRVLMEGVPHQLIEGMIIAAYAIQAQEAYIFLRDEYKLSARRLRNAIDEAYEKKYLGPEVLGSRFALELKLHTSAGRYICGEETGLLNALEGKRALPRSKPPYPQTSGLWGKPTVVNNVETLSCVPHILKNGPGWFKDLSLSPGNGGTKIYGASGNVKNPGWWELPMGTTIREILERAGGMKPGYKLRGILPGGASTDFLVEEHLDLKMDFDSLQVAGSRMGTGTMIIMDDRVCPVGVVLSLIKFFARESCGWCSPCWSGLQMVEELLRSIEEGAGKDGDLETLEEHCELLGPGHTYCALAPGAAEPLQSALKHFRADFERHISGKACPWKVKR